MTHYGSKELAASFRTVRDNTIQVAQDIPEASYGFRPAPGTRTVSETLVHIAVITRVPLQIHFTDKLTSLVGFDYLGFVEKLVQEGKVSRSKEQVIALLQSEGEKFATRLEGCTEEFLAQTVAYPPEMSPPSKSRFEMLLATKEHEMHHRAQLMVVERMLGITPHLTRRIEEFLAKAKAAKA